MITFKNATFFFIYFFLVAPILLGLEVWEGMRWGSGTNPTCLYFCLREVIPHLYTSRYIAHRPLVSGGRGQVRIGQFLNTGYGSCTVLPQRTPQVKCPHTRQIYLPVAVSNPGYLKYKSNVLPLGHQRLEKTFIIIL